MNALIQVGYVKQFIEIQLGREKRAENFEKLFKIKFRKCIVWVSIKNLKKKKVWQMLGQIIDSLPFDMIY